MNELKLFFTSALFSRHFFRLNICYVSTTHYVCMQHTPKHIYHGKSKHIVAAADFLCSFVFLVDVSKSQNIWLMWWKAESQTCNAIDMHNQYHVIWISVQSSNTHCWQFLTLNCLSDLATTRLSIFILLYRFAEKLFFALVFLFTCHQ